MQINDLWYRRLAVAVLAVGVGATAFWALSGGGGGAGAPLLRVEESNGIAVVRLSGAPRGKGSALGRALRARIRDELGRALPGDAGLRDFVVRTAGGNLAPFLPAAYREEIEGVAEGAGIPFEEALFLNTRFELAAHRLAGGEADAPAEGAAGPGPSAGCLFAAGAERDLVVVVHEDREPPLWLVARPGMIGGFLGVRGNVAAAMRPIKSDTPPGLHGLVWTLLLRRQLEEGRAPPEVTGGVSLAMALPDGSAATINFAARALTSYAAGGAATLTTDEPVGARHAIDRDPAERERVLAEAARLLAGPPPPGRAFFGLFLGVDGVRLAVADEAGRRESRLAAR